MGFFNRRRDDPGEAAPSNGSRCVICDEPFSDPGRTQQHCATHVVGQAGKYAWECNCGEHDGFWEHEGQAALALLLHMSDRHNMKVDIGYGPEYMKYPGRI